MLKSSESDVTQEYVNRLELRVTQLERELSEVKVKLAVLESTMESTFQSISKNLGEINTTLQEVSKKFNVWEGMKKAGMYAITILGAGITAEHTGLVKILHDVFSP